MGFIVAIHGFIIRHSFKNLFDVFADGFRQIGKTVYGMIAAFSFQFGKQDKIGEKVLLAEPFAEHAAFRFFFTGQVVGARKVVEGLH